MNKSKVISEDKYELVVTDSRWSIGTSVVLVLCACIACLFLLEGFNQILAFIILILVLVLGLRDFNNPKIKMKVNENGIWTKKTGQIDWNDISYFYYTNRYAKFGNIISLYFMLYTQKSELIIDLSNANPGITKIRTVINKYKGDHSVDDFGEK